MNLALAAAAATGVQVGAAIVASRFAVAEVPPFTLAMWRYAIGFCCLLPFVMPFVPSFVRPTVVGRRAPWPPARDLAVMAALGIGQFGVLIALLNLGLQQIGAAQAAMILSLFPLLTLLIGAALGRERVTPTLVWGVLLSIGGVVLSLIPKLSNGQASAHWWGELAVVGAAATGALCSVLYRPWLQRYPTVPVSAFAMFASVLFLGLLALTELRTDSNQALPSARACLAVLFIGVSSGLGYFLWLYALKRESPTRVTVFLALNPVTAAVLGWALLGELLPPSSWAALAMIALGLWLATRTSKVR